MDLSELRIGSRVGRRGVAVAGVLCALLLAVAATPQLLGPEVRRAFAGLEQAQPAWLWLAAVGFVAAPLCNPCAWRATVELCGRGGGLGAPPGLLRGRGAPGPPPARRGRGPPPDRALLRR